MRWKHRVIVCCSSLVLLGFAGCAKRVRITIDASLAPITAITAPGQTLEWTAATPGESFVVHWQPGLCQQGTPNPIPASYGKPATCIVAPQNPKQAATAAAQAPQQANAPPPSPQPSNTGTEYTYTLEGNKNGNPFTSPEYSVSVGPRGCHICP